jgi:homoserine kinase type II
LAVLSSDSLSQASVLVCRRYGPSFPPHSLVFLGNHGGFSGARLWRGQGPLGPFCLRAWPASTTADRVLFCHRLMSHACGKGLEQVPTVFTAVDGASVVEEAERVWEITAWLPGQPDFRAAPSIVRLQAACAGLAQLHRAWEDFVEPAARVPAVCRRLELLAYWEAIFRSSERPPLLSEVVLFHPIWAVLQRAWRTVHSRLAEVPQLLRPWRTFVEPVQPCLCDVWHDNLLFEGEHLTGIVDYGAAKVDHVAVDLARLLGSLVGDDAAGWSAGLAAYRRIRPLTDAAEGLARVLDRTGLVLAVANWLLRMAHEPCSAEALSRVQRRLEELLQRVEGQPSAAVSPGGIISNREEHP